MFSDQGVQLCIVPRNSPELCTHPAQAVGPRELIEPLVAQSVTRAAQTFARLGRNPGQSLTELECVFAGAALADRRQQLQALRARGDVLDARLRRKVDVQSIADANPSAFRPGLLATVVERWRGEIRHADGSDEGIEPRRQTWRYVLQKGDGTAVGPDGNPCESGLVISEATLLP